MSQIDLGRIVTFFQRKDLLITIDTNLKNVNLLSITLDLQLEQYKHYRKPNEKLYYIS